MAVTGDPMMSNSESLELTVQTSQKSKGIDQHYRSQRAGAHGSLSGEEGVEGQGSITEGATPQRVLPERQNVPSRLG